MSYVRLLRLPPHSETIGRGANGWRRHLSTRRPTSGSPSSAEHACSGWHQRGHLRAGSHALGKGEGDSMVHAKTQGLPGMRGYEEDNKNSDSIISRNWKNENTTVHGANPKSAAFRAFGDSRSSFDRERALLLRSAHSTGSSPFWGALGNEWDHRSGFVQSQPLRSFASSTPTKPDVKVESSDTSKRTGLQPRQRASLGDLLKPSDKEIEPVKDESAQRFKDLQEEYTLYEAARKDPKQASEQVEQSQMALTRKKAVAMVKKIPVMTWNATKAIVLFLWEIIKNPLVLKDKLGVAQYHLKEFGRHYWLGLKLLWGDIKTAKKILRRILRGFPMTRRERKQLLRTVSDIFRMVPLAAFVLIPFMEFLLPVALKVFPNMLPSTFQEQHVSNLMSAFPLILGASTLDLLQDNLKEEEKLKKELRLRMAYAGFLQETVTAMAVKKKTRAEDGEESEATTGELTEFIEKAKMGEITNQDIPKFAKMFKDELTMDNISRSGLVNMCRYMGVPPFGNDNFLRYFLRSKLRAITQDDQRILWEGVSSLTKQELQEACRERGMRATGLTKQGYVRQLSQWLDLSTKKSVPISLLIMSRAFTLQAPDPAKALAQSISAMDDDVVTEVMIEAASSEEQKTPEYRTRKLESLTRQNELIEEENRKREEAEQAQEAKKAEEASKAEELKAAEVKEAGEVGADGVSSNVAAETAEDEAVDKLIEKAAVEAAARTAPGDALPQVEMQEGQQRFRAASGVEAKKGTEPVTTEANLVAPSTGVGVGDRLVASKPAKSKQSKKASKTSAVNTPKVELDQRVGDVTDAERQLSASKEVKDTAEDGGNKLTNAELAALESLASPSSVEKERAQLAMMKAALQESLGKPDETERKSVETGDASDAEGASKESGPPTSEKDDTTRGGAGEQTQPKGEHEMPPAEKPDTLKETAEPPSVAMASGDGATSESEGAADVQEDAKAEEPAVDKSVERVQTKLASMLNRLELEIQSVEQRIGDKMHVLDRDSDGMVSAEEIAHVVQHVLATKSTATEAKAIAEDMDTDSDGQISVAELIAWVKKNSEQDAEHVFDEIYQRETKETPTKPPAAKE